MKKKIYFHENNSKEGVFNGKGGHKLHINPSLTPIVVESRCYYTFEVLAMNSVSYKFLFF